MHLQEEAVVLELRVEGLPHPHQPRVLEGVRARGVGEDPDALRAAAGLEHRGPGAVGVDHAVPVVGIGDARQGLGADHQRPLRVARLQEVVHLDDGLQPSRAAEGQVVGDARGVGDAERALDPRGQGRHEVGARVAGAHVAEVVGDDQVVEALGIDRAVGQRVARGLDGDVGGDEVVVRVAALADPGDLPEPVDDLRVARGRRTACRSPRRAGGRGSPRSRRGGRGCSSRWRRSRRKWRRSFAGGHIIAPESAHGLRPALPSARLRHFAPADGRRMGLFATTVQRISDHPVLFIVLRSILENDFKAIRAVIRRRLRVRQGLRTLDLGCGPGRLCGPLRRRRLRRRRPQRPLHRPRAQDPAGGVHRRRRPQGRAARRALRPDPDLRPPPPSLRRGRARGPGRVPPAARPRRTRAGDRGHPRDLPPEPHRPPDPPGRERRAHPARRGVPAPVFGSGDDRVGRSAPERDLRLLRRRPGGEP